jgi:hypothetical protein
MNTNLFFDLMIRLFSALAAIREQSCSFLAESAFYIEDQAEFSFSRSFSSV